eukprot:COSAG02_NODE_9445_length_2213_cov_3.542100_1_plen_91_part_10
MSSNSAIPTEHPTEAAPDLKPHAGAATRASSLPPAIATTIKLSPAIVPLFSTATLMSMNSPATQAMSLPEPDAKSTNVLLPGSDNIHAWFS